MWCFFLLLFLGGGVRGGGHIDFFFRGEGGGHREGSGVHTWSKNSKLTLISGLVSADASADALAIINIG